MPARKAPGRPSSEARILMSPSRSIPQNVLLPIVSLRFCMVWNEGKPLLPDLSYHEMESSHIGYFPGMGRQIGNNKNARNWNGTPLPSSKAFCSVLNTGQIVMAKVLIMPQLHLCRLILQFFSLILECLRVAILRVAVSMWTCHVKGENFSPTH